MIRDIYMIKQSDDSYLEVIVTDKDLEFFLKDTNSSFKLSKETLPNLVDALLKIQNS